MLYAMLFQALGVFGLCQIYAFIEYIRSKLNNTEFDSLISFAMSTIGALLAVGLIVLSLSGKVAPWTGRFYALLDPSYAKVH